MEQETRLRVCPSPSFSSAVGPLLLILREELSEMLSSSFSFCFSTACLWPWTPLMTTPSGNTLPLVPGPPATCLSWVSRRGCLPPYISAWRLGREPWALFRCSVCHRLFLSVLMLFTRGFGDSNLCLHPSLSDLRTPVCPSVHLTFPFLLLFTPLSPQSFRSQLECHLLQEALSGHPSALTALLGHNY